MFQSFISYRKPAPRVVQFVMCCCPCFRCYFCGV